MPSRLPAALMPMKNSFRLCGQRAHFWIKSDRLEELTAIAPAFLQAIYSIPSFGIAKFAVNVCPLDTSKNTSKTIRCSGRFRELLLMFSNAPPKLS